ncbi:hypothetical protein [Maribacter sp. 2308TA10-17]|uniref:hypothetical protein n=1 Tax=Maribacter sp. 2308TA10-17 TaxID=3386276 RepID=UPI0039BD1581
MKRHFQTAVIVLAIGLLSACGTYKSEQQAAALTFPELASMVRTKGKLWFASTEQVGNPNWEQPIAITVQQLPFNRASYGTYTSHMVKAGKINGITYRDSLPIKPKYLRLQLLNKINITEQLNASENSNIRNYLATDNSYKMVTRFDITAADVLMVQLLEANTVQLAENDALGKYLILTKNSKETTIPFSDLEVFDYGFSSFCWGEDRYHRKRIEAILTGNASCPKGTYKKASKVTADKSYLKF